MYNKYGLNRSIGMSSFFLGFFSAFIPFLIFKKIFFVTRRGVNKEEIFNPKKILKRFYLAILVKFVMLITVVSLVIFISNNRMDLFFTGFCLGIIFSWSYSFLKFRIT